jgi:hypothetical protein
MTFWQWIYLLHQHTAGCTARTESTHSAVVYGGNCVQAWLLSLHIPGVAWIFN